MWIGLPTSTQVRGLVEWKATVHRSSHLFLLASHPATVPLRCHRPVPLHEHIRFRRPHRPRSCHSYPVTYTASTPPNGLGVGSSRERRLGKVSDLRRSHAPIFGPVSFEPYSKDGQTRAWPAQATWAYNVIPLLLDPTGSTKRPTDSHDFQMLGSVQRTWTAWTAWAPCESPAEHCCVLPGKMPTLKIFRLRLRALPQHLFMSLCLVKARVLVHFLPTLLGHGPEGMLDHHPDLLRTRWPATAVHPAITN